MEGARQPDARLARIVLPRLWLGQVRADRSGSTSTSLDHQGGCYCFICAIVTTDSFGADLDLGFAYLSTQSWIDRATPLMRELSERLGESCSAAILQGNDIVYVARMPARRIMSAALSVGSRLPALHTALGRTMFGYLDEAEIWRRLKSQRIEAYTPQTITDLQALFDRIRADRAQRFSIVDEELERGLRALAVPVLDRSGQAVGAINLSTHSTRTTRNEMREHFLPELNRIAEQVSAMTV